jgi:hypothetical protein
VDIFCNQKQDEKEIAISKPILEKREKTQQAKTAYHLIYI